MSRIGLTRLKRLARGLRAGVKGVDFDFSVWHSVANPEYGERPCACAVGHCVYLFPADWCLSEIQAPVLRGAEFDEDEPSCSLESAMRFFDLDLGEASHLFTAERQNPEAYGGRKLSSDATEYEVASNIEAFVAMKEGGL